jgi:hypothetical protein
MVHRWTARELELGGGAEQRKTVVLVLSCSREEEFGMLVRVEKMDKAKRYLNF